MQEDAMDLSDFGQGAYDFVDGVIDQDQDGAWIDDGLQFAVNGGTTITGAVVGGLLGGPVGAGVGAGIAQLAKPLGWLAEQTGDFYSDFAGTRGPVSATTSDGAYDAGSGPTLGQMGREALGPGVANAVLGGVGAASGAMAGMSQAPLGGILGGLGGASAGSALGGMGGGLGGGALAGAGGVLGGGASGAVAGATLGSVLGPLGMMAGGLLGGAGGALLGGGLGALGGGAGGALLGSGVGATAGLVGGGVTGALAPILGGAFAGGMMANPDTNPFLHFSD
jgi:hypothetical protein